MYEINEGLKKEQRMFQSIRPSKSGRNFRYVFIDIDCSIPPRSVPLGLGTITGIRIKIDENGNLY